MNKKHINIEQLRKSKFHDNSSYNMFIKILILFILLIIILTLIWVFYGKLDVVIKSNGIIKYQENISTIYNIKGGFLKEIIDGNTLKVKKGELLFEIEKSNIENQKKYLEKEIKKDKNYLAELKEFKKYLLSKNTKKLNEIILLKNEAKLIKEKINFYNTKIDNKKKKVSNLKKLKGIGITEMEFLNEKEKLNDLIFKLESIINDKLVNLNKRMVNKRKSIDNNLLEIKQISNNLKEYKVKAPINGSIEFIKKYNVGDYIPAGKEVLKIMPNSQDKFIVELIVKNKDILRIKKNNLIRYRISSYPYKEFGIAEGKVLKIDRDVTKFDKNNYAYKITASIKDYLIKGNKKKYVNFRNGMLTKATIVVDKRKIIYYILEKLDFLNFNSM